MLRRHSRKKNSKTTKEEELFCCKKKHIILCLVATVKHSSRHSGWIVVFTHHSTSILLSPYKKKQNYISTVSKNLLKGSRKKPPNIFIASGFQVTFLSNKKCLWYKHFFSNSKKERQLQDITISKKTFIDTTLNHQQQSFLNGGRIFKVI